MLSVSDYVNLIAAGRNPLVAQDLLAPQ